MGRACAAHMPQRCRPCTNKYSGQVGRRRSMSAGRDFGKLTLKAFIGQLHNLGGAFIAIVPPPS